MIFISSLNTIIIIIIYDNSSGDDDNDDNLSAKSLEVNFVKMKFDETVEGDGGRGGGGEGSREDGY